MVDSPRRENGLAKKYKEGAALLPRVGIAVVGFLRQTCVDGVLVKREGVFKRLPDGQRIIGLEQNRKDSQVEIPDSIRTPWIAVQNFELAGALHE